MPGPLTTARLLLQLQGQDADLLRSAEGGDLYGEIVRETTLPRPGVAAARKRIGAARYRDITIECPLPLSQPLANWVSATLAGSAPRVNGAVVMAAFDYSQESRLVFTNAAIREIEFPALDAADKQDAYLTVRFAPETTQRQAGTGAQPITSGGAKSAGRAARSNFRLAIDGLDTSQINSVGPIVVRQVFLEPTAGEVRVSEALPWLEVSDLVVTLPEAADWYAWRDAFVGAGTGVERRGTLELVSQDRTSVVARIEFRGLGIHSLVRERIEQRAPDIPGGPRVRAAMYCEEVVYGVGGPAQLDSQTPIASEVLVRSRVGVTAPLGAGRL
jgi:hypothetical protein